MNIFRKFNGVVLLVVIVLILAGCGGDEENPASANSSDSSAQSGAQSAAELPADPLAAITQALKNQQTAGPYRVKTTIDAADGKMTMNGEIIPPDQMHITMDLGDAQQEMVFIGDKGWMKMGDEWIDSPMKGSDMMAQMNSMGADLLAETASEIVKVGNETVEGQAAVLYSYNMDMNKSSTMKMDMKSSVKMWVRAVDGLPIKQEISGEAMGVKSVTTQVIEYDANIKIEAPVK